MHTSMHAVSGAQRADTAAVATSIHIDIRTGPGIAKSYKAKGGKRLRAVQSQTEFRDVVVQ